MQNKYLTPGKPLVARKTSIRTEPLVRSWPNVIHKFTIGDWTSDLWPLNLSSHNYWIDLNLGNFVTNFSDVNENLNYTKEWNLIVSNLVRGQLYWYWERLVWHILWLTMIKPDRLLYASRCQFHPNIGHKKLKPFWPLFGCTGCANYRRQSRVCLSFKLTPAKNSQ